MASTKRQTTMAKMAREQAVRERRVRKQQQTPEVASQVLISSHSPFVICEAWNGEERNFIYQVKPEKGQALIRPITQVISEHQIQLGKKDGERTHLSLNTANEVMAGYYS